MKGKYPTLLLFTTLIPFVSLKISITAFKIWKNLYCFIIYLYFIFILMKQLWSIVFKPLTFFFKIFFQLDTFWNLFFNEKSIACLQDSTGLLPVLCQDTNISVVITTLPIGFKWNQKLNFTLKQQNTKGVGKGLFGCELHSPSPSPYNTALNLK